MSNITKLKVTEREIVEFEIWETPTFSFSLIQLVMCKFIHTQTQTGGIGLRRQEDRIKDIDKEMFVRILTVHCDQNNSYEITINGFQVRKI